MKIIAPFKEAFFTSPNILSKVWVKYFAQIDSNAEASDNAETKMLFENISKNYDAVIAELQIQIALLSNVSYDLARSWPIGSIFISVVATNPSLLLGFGTWVAFGTGKVLVGIDPGDTDFDTVEETGGAKTHNHSVDVGSTVSSGPSATVVVASGTGATVATNTHTHTTDPAAVTSTTVSNVMPYIVCYFWKREN